MHWKNRTAFAVLVALGFLALAATASAQPVRSRILEGFEVKRAPAGFDLLLRFNVPLQLQWHTPKERGDVVRVKVDPLRVSRDDFLTVRTSESLAIPSDLPIPLLEINYDGDPTDGPFVEVRFSRSVRFEVRQGSDFRSVVISIVGGIRHIYAVQLHSAPLAEPLPALPRSELIDRFRVYTAKFSKNGAPWRRLRLGFFATPSGAAEVAKRMRRHFPEAFVLEVSEDEVAAAGATTVSPPTHRPTPSPKTRAPERRPAPPASVPSRELMEEGRNALTAGEIDKAIAIFEKLLALPSSDETREAKELLGLARERNGQLAHAKAEYEDYLRLYPEGAGAERVRQRLNTLLTASEEPVEPFPSPAALDSHLDLLTFGSLFASYRHDSRFIGDLDEALENSSLFTDLFLETRLRNDAYTIRGQVSGGYRHDFVPESEGEMRFNTLFIDVTDHERDLSGFIGRRSQSTGGVLGRFDGGRIAKRLPRNFEVAAVGGFPVQSPTYWSLDTDQSFAGVSIGWDGFADSVESELFFVHQMREGRTDRSALGGEVRYSDASRYVYAYVDFDVHFTSFNIAQLVGNWNVTSSTFLNFTVDYRNSPILTLSNALQGQLVDSIGGLLDLFELGEIESLAVDRTATSLSINAGIRQGLTDRLQASFDFTASEITGTPASGGVALIAGTGFEFSYFGQLIANDLFVEGDFGTLGLRIFDGSLTDIFTFSLDSRFPLTSALRINPRFRTEYRSNRGGSDSVLVSPSCRLDYRFWKLRLETEAGIDWIGRGSSNVAADEWGYYASGSIRFDF